MRRVVVTGIGAITPLANGATLTWERLIASQSGIRAIEAFDVSDLAAKIAGMIPLQLAGIGITQQQLEHGRGRRALAAAY